MGKPKNDEIRKILTPEKLKEELETLSGPEIAKKYNCNKSMIPKLKKEYGFVVKQIKVDAEDRYRPPSELRIALIKQDLAFTQQEIFNLKELWKAGILLKDMVAYMKRHELEVRAMLSEMIYKNELKPRPNGVFGEVG